MVLWSLGRSPHGFAYGAVTLYGGPFQATSATVGRLPGARSPSPGTHQPLISPRLSRGELVWAFPLSVAPTQGIPCWFLFLPLLRCFRSGGSRPVLPLPRGERFPGRRGLFAPGGRSHSAIPGSTATCAYPGLIAACHGLPRRPSQAIHRAASVPQARGRGAEPRIRPVPPGAPCQGSWMSPSRAYLSMALTTAPSGDKHKYCTPGRGRSRPPHGTSPRSRAASGRRSQTSPRGQDW